METFTVFDGRGRPLVARGKMQCHILDFAEKHRHWHVAGRRPGEKRAVRALAKRGALDILEDCRRLRRLIFQYPK